MWLVCIIALICVAQRAHAFVYSCDQVLYTLMNSEFEQHSKYAYVIPETGYSNWALLKQLHMNAGQSSWSFAEIAFHIVPRVEIPTNGSESWSITSDATLKPAVQLCDRQFTIIFTSDEHEIIFTASLTPLPENIITLLPASGDYLVVVQPRAGLVINMLATSGEGTVTMYSGAGTGESEELYELQTWPCDSIPAWIYSFEIVVTLQGASCVMNIMAGFSVEPCEFHAHSLYWTVHRFDKVVVLFSGRSNNLQNLQGMEKIAYVKIGTYDTKSSVNMTMDLLFDTNNTGYLEVQKSFAGEVIQFLNGSYNEQFHTNYLEVRWNPSPLQASEVSTNQDFVCVEIDISPFDDDYDCPDGYSLMSSMDDQHWCYFPVYSANADDRFTFTDALSGCSLRGDVLPILNSQGVNTKFEVDLLWYNSLQYNVWIGLVCDNGNLVWQDGEPVDYDAFESPPSDLSCDDSSHYAFVDGANWTLFSSDEAFEGYLCARRAIPNSNSTTSQATTHFPSSEFPTWAIVLIVVCVVLLLGSLIGIVVCARMRIQMMKSRVIEEQLKNEDNSISNQDSNSDWEIDRIFVGIDYSRKLGEGAFGNVYLGHVFAKNIPCGMGRSIVELAELTNKEDAVAVKMLHNEQANSAAAIEFRSEIELLKKIGYHERLVNMLACVTATSPTLLICEYCSNGDLLNFMRLRKWRTYMLDHPENETATNVITGKKQLSFAIQIAYGLEFLSSRGFIHRDVAARNILVDHKETCKIGDFGLARAISKDGEIYQAFGRKLPLKWMSPEAIEKFFFSTSADVWSFGVLLFEIVTLGGTPYADWKNAEILPRLKRGERMNRPDNCSEELFAIMCQSWHSQPANRPTFVELRRRLGDLLDEIDEDYYLKLNAKAQYYFPRIDSAEESE